MESSQAQQYATRLGDSLKPIFEKYGIRQAILFGSHARGDETRRSDVDLLLVQETGKRFLDRYAGILAEITSRVPGRDVDVLIYTPAELAQMADRPFVAAALREGVILYECAQEPTSG